ncbi:hypothetical protein ELY21_09340 [Legionella sp. km535]|uniref:hypothetical protein n=1 Tax=Legionella sp. km535 TaxID=2498107 RepID=UPI000F8C32B5|nr:hypothetical protein [Legionella sp. km535]RUR17938.1 hypothetical protein ELY21_09340 [Legionella sp. km535]
MLVLKVIQLIQELESSGPLIPCDIKLHQSLSARFKDSAPVDVLSSADVQFLLESYKERWTSVKDTEDDYTLNSQGINQVWIQFAQELAEENNKHLFQILSPLLVLRVIQLIQELESSGPLIPCDIKLHQSLSARFKDSDPMDVLSSADVQFLLESYKARWKSVMDTEDDYTLNSQGINQVWIKFAQELAEENKKHLFQILIPFITNDKDFNNLTCLTETTRMDNFYVGHGGHTLYRKRGFCEHLLKNGFMLSTYRDLSNVKLHLVTVDELSRLKSCKQTNGEFKIGSEVFVNFWDFLNRKVFPRLLDNGELPMELLPRLLRLVEQYHTFKNASADYTNFKRSANEFFRLLAQGDLHNINCFYGQQISFQSKDYYLLDFLIAINMSRSYDLDQLLHTLLLWLYNINPALKSSLAILESVYNSITSLASSSSSSGQSVSIPSEDHHQPLKHCYRLIVSLMTSAFEMWPLTERTISLWDLNNDVFPEAMEIYNCFLPALNENREQDLEAIYLFVKQHYFAPAPVKMGFFSWISGFYSTTRWYEHVRQETLNRLGVYWHEPELILHALLRFKPTSSVITPHINLFLDELLHTYAQTGSDLLKRFRVNIFFTRLLKKFDAEDKTDLIRLLQLYDLGKTSTVFLDNCAHHIGNRLNQINLSQPGHPQLFYSFVCRADKSKVSISMTGLKQVSCIIDAFKEASSSPSLKLTESSRQSMLSYLRNLARPILTVGELEVASNSSQCLDYLGAPT